MTITDNKENIVKQIVSILISKNNFVDEKIITNINDFINSKFDNYDDTISLIDDYVKLNYNIDRKKELSSDEKYIPKFSYETNVKIIKNYDKKRTKKVKLGSFVKYFKQRFKEVKKLLSGRPELQAMNSISVILGKEEREEVSTIGMISDISETKNENIMLTIEDETGSIKVLVNKNKQNLIDFAKELVLDDIIGVVGNTGEKIIFANNLLLPDIPNTKEYKKSPDDVHACFISDIHFGSNEFLRKSFDKFIKWLNGKVGDEKQKEIADKIKYVFIVGDLVDGVGIYPGQDTDLYEKNIYGQYKECFENLDKIPKDKHIIIIPGNHDAVRLAEPQPTIPEKYIQGADFSNFYFASNPSVVNIHSSEDFDGFNILLYHGYSFDYYVANVSSIRNNGGYDRSDLIMKFMLQRRHLAPSYTSTLYFIDEDEDPLVINPIPDFFATGHIHKTSVSNYKNITLISGSAWQDMTDFQEKLGHTPEPGRVPVVNLSTRDIKIMRF